MDKTSNLIDLFRNRRFDFVSGWRNPVGIGVCCPVHAHPTIEIVYHPTGSGFTTIAGSGNLDFVPGSVVIYPPHQRHDQTMAAPGEDWCLHVAMSGATPRAMQSCLYIAAIDDPYARDELDRLARPQPELTEFERIALGHRATALIMHLLHATTAIARDRAPPSADGYAEKAHRHIAANYQSIASVAEVADHVGVSHDYLRHCFKDRYRASLTGWLSEVRIERAKELLVHSRLPLRTVAAMCGFANERYFSSVFRKRAACAPGEFRKNR